MWRYYAYVPENRIEDVKFKTYGCGSAIASSSMATEMIKGKTIDEVLEVTNKAVAEALDGLPPVKMHCSVLAEEAIVAALQDYAKKNNLEIPGIIDEILEIEIEIERVMSILSIFYWISEKKMLLSIDVFIDIILKFG